MSALGRPQQRGACAPHIHFPPAAAEQDSEHRASGGQNLRKFSSAVRSKVVLQNAYRTAHNTRAAIKGAQDSAMLIASGAVMVERTEDAPNVHITLQADQALACRELAGRTTKR